MKAKEVLRLLEISRVTLSTYVRKGYIGVIELPGGQYNYNSKDVFKYIKKNTRHSVIYSRVSTYKQKGDLKRQTSFLKSYCKKKSICIDKVYEEVSSGLDLDRKLFSQLMDDVFNYKIRNIIISNKDRLTRLSYTTIKNIFKKFATEIIVVNDKIARKKNTKNKTKGEDTELFEELISLIHIFSTKMYSKRRRKKLKIIKKDLNLESEKY